MDNVIQETTPETGYPEGWEKSFYEEKVEKAFVSIKQHIRIINEHERELFAAVKKLMGPSLLDYRSPRRAIVLAAHTSIEKTMYAFGHQMEAVQSSVKAIAMLSRLRDTVESLDDDDEEPTALEAVEGEHHE